MANKLAKAEFILAQNILIENKQIKQVNKCKTLEIYIDQHFILLLLYTANSINVVLSKAQTLNYERVRDDGLLLISPLNSESSL